MKCTRLNRITKNGIKKGLYWSITKIHWRYSYFRILSLSSTGKSSRKLNFWNNLLYLVKKYNLPVLLTLNQSCCFLISNVWMVLIWVSFYFQKSNIWSGCTKHICFSKNSMNIVAVSKLWHVWSFKKVRKTLLGRVYRLKKDKDYKRGKFLRDSH